MQHGSPFPGKQWIWRRGIHLCHPSRGLSRCPHGSWGAERLASVPVDKAVQLLAGAACPTGVTVCEDYIMMPGAVGMLSPSDSDSVGPVGHVGTWSPSDSASVGPVGTLSPSDSVSVGHDGPDGTLSSSDFAGMLFPAVPAGIPFPVGPVGPVGPDGTLSSSDLAGMLSAAVPAGIPFPVGPVGPDGTLSSSVFAGILIPAVPAGFPFPAGPVGRMSQSDFESTDPINPVGTLSPFDHAEGLSPIVPVSELLSVDPGLDGISGQEGPRYYTVACRSAYRG